MQNKFREKWEIVDERGGLKRSKVCLFVDYLCKLLKLMKQDCSNGRHYE